MLQKRFYLFFFFLNYKMY